MSIMKEREDLLENKKDEIRNIIQKNLICFSLNNIDNIEIERSLYDCNCLSITPPLEEPPMMGLLTMDSLKNYHQGRSIKPGNIKVNIKHLIDTLPQIVTCTVSLISDIDVLKICAAISIWKNLRDALTIEIKKEHAIVIIALWKKCNEKHKINLEDGYNATNLLCRQLSENEFTWEQYIDIIDLLTKWACIELDDEGIWLREWVSEKYID